MERLYWDDSGEVAISDALYELLTKVVQTGLQRADAPADVELSISFVTKQEMRLLNNEYRGIDAPTDVLSFNGMPPFALGDIIICTEVAQEQAQAYGHSFERETAFLTAHGLLHLLGHDHEDEEQEKVMLAEQEGILNALGVKR
jgi:probable rRNA maturation factor